MREFYIAVLKKHFSNRLMVARAAMNLTQPQMAEVLGVCVRSYANLDHGVHTCSGLTLARYLVYCCPNPMAFLDELYAAFEEDNLHLPRLSGDIAAKDALTYRYSLPVTKRALTIHNTFVSLCPRCAQQLKDGQRFCSCCGQKLDWPKQVTRPPRILH